MNKYSLNIKRIIINICIILCVFVLFSFISNFIYGNKNINTESIIVKDNDTLWSIANTVCEKYSKELNIQNVVIEIKQINNLKNSNIYSGQILAIPVYL